MLLVVGGWANFVLPPYLYYLARTAGPKGIPVADGLHIEPRSPPASPMLKQAVDGAGVDPTTEIGEAEFEAAVPWRGQPHLLVVGMYMVLLVVVALGVYWRVDFETDPSKAWMGKDPREHINHRLISAGVLPAHSQG